MKQAPVQVYVLAPELLRDAIISLFQSYSIETVEETEAHSAVLLVAGIDWPSRLSRFRERHGKNLRQRMMLLTQSTDPFLTTALESGFRVIVEWDDRNSFQAALHTAAAGGAFCSIGLLAGTAYQATKSPTSEVMSRLSNLSQREREVLLLVVRGLTNQQIAARLCVALVTVKMHLGQIFRKCGVQRRAELLALLAILSDFNW